MISFSRVLSATLPDGARVQIVAPPATRGPLALAMFADGPWCGMGATRFDADLMRGGTYELKSTQGDIQIRITAEAGFRLLAVAPVTRP